MPKRIKEYGRPLLRPKHIPHGHNKMFTDQDGLCKICRVKLPENRPGRFTCIDHEHDTGEIRALLCIECNSGLGFFKERADLLERATLYIAKKGKI